MVEGRRSRSKSSSRSLSYHIQLACQISLGSRRIWKKNPNWGPTASFERRRARNRNTVNAHMAEVPCFWGISSLPESISTTYFRRPCRLKKCKYSRENLGVFPVNWKSVDLCVLCLHNMYYNVKFNMVTVMWLRGCLCKMKRRLTQQFTHKYPPKSNTDTTP